MKDAKGKGGRRGRTPKSLNATMGISGGAMVCVEAVATLLSGGGFLSASQIAETIGTDRLCVLRSMPKLRDAGIVSASRKRNGGYRLEADPDTITVLDVIRAVDGGSHGSLFSDETCIATKMTLRNSLRHIPIKWIALEVRAPSEREAR